MKVSNGLDLLGQKITNLGDPSNPQDAATLSYVQNFLRGITYKAPVIVASTSNINLASPGASIDSIAMSSGDRFLAKNQTNPIENGIYVWNGASSAATRSIDADDGTELTPGTCLFVIKGSTNADKAYLIISDTPITIGTSAITWGQFGGGIQYTGSNGVVLNGLDFQGVVAPSGGLVVGASGFAIDTSIIPRKISGNIGNGSLTSISVTHNLGTKDVNVSLREVSNDKIVLVDWVATDINTVTFTFATAPSASQYRFTIMG